MEVNYNDVLTRVLNTYKELKELEVHSKHNKINKLMSTKDTDVIVSGTVTVHYTSNENKVNLTKVCTTGFDKECPHSNVTIKIRVHSYNTENEYINCDLVEYCVPVE